MATGTATRGATRQRGATTNEATTQPSDSVQLGARIPRAQYEKIQKAAKKEGVTVSALVRRWADEQWPMGRRRSGS